METERAVFTVGYGGRQLDDFLCLVKAHQIDVVCDVRTTPYSSRYSDYNREVLQANLKNVGLKYLFLGDELGARPSDALMYVAGRVSYSALGQSSAFRSGIERVELGCARFRVALMCAEKDPLGCHRAILIAPALLADGITVLHLNGDDELESHAALERRLLRKYGLDQRSLFELEGNDDALADAYARRAEELAFDIEADRKARAW